MLTVLSASAGGFRVSPVRAFCAAAFHGAVIFAAVRVTTGASPLPVHREVILDPFVLGPIEQPRETPAERASEEPGAPVSPQFELPPVEMPSAIPPIVRGPTLEGVLNNRALAFGPVTTAGSGSVGVEAVVLAGEADVPAEVVHQPAPRYPPALQHAGLEGRVVLEFIIDTTGHVEPGSLRVLERSRPGFDGSAVETILASLFRPAQVRGRPVRQRTIQAVVFRIRD